jgi:Fungal Zn(2)-Cys(6) binuclear cluster domain
MPAMSATRIIVSDNKMHKSPVAPPPTGNHGLNSRSCITCSRRKVKCDRRHPCYHCTKANVACCFPPPGRAPRKSQKSTEGNLHERLRRLERFIQSLGTPIPTDKTLSKVIDSEINHASPQFGTEPQETEKKPTDLDGISSRFGSLIVTEDSSRYISPGLWSHLNDEVLLSAPRTILVR